MQSPLCFAPFVVTFICPVNSERWYGTLTNFYNANDFALATGQWGGVATNWEAQQNQSKPDAGVNWPLVGRLWHYDYSPAAALGERASLTRTLQTGNVVSRFVTESWEMKAFVARPRTKAVGAIAHDNAHQGHFDSSVNLNVAPYNFGGTREDHSGEFTRSIQQLDALFMTIRAKLAE